MAHPYCTVDEVKAEFPFISETEWGVGLAPDDTKLAAMIEENDSDIDAALDARFAVPFGTVPQSIMRISRDLTVADVRELVFSEEEQPDRVGPGRRKRAETRLTAIADGSYALDAQGAPQADTVAGDDRRPTGTWEDDADVDDRAFGRDTEW